MVVVKFGAVQYRTVQCSTARRSAVRCGAVQCGGGQYDAMRCSPVRCSSVWCSVVQYKAVTRDWVADPTLGDWCSSRGGTSYSVGSAAVQSRDAGLSGGSSVGWLVQQM